MKTLAKRRAIQSFLILLAIWPAVHFGLAARFRFDPWELFGWAMYSLPQVRYEMALEGRVAGVGEEFLPAGPMRTTHRWEVRQRALLGEFHSLDGYAAQLLDRYPRFESITIVERHWTLDRDSARLDYRDTRLEFPRPKPSDAR